MEDEGWWREGAGSPIRQLMPDSSRVVLRRTDRYDQSFAQSLDPYRGCELGCVYCDARVAYASLGLSPNLDFETRIFHKPHAVRLLRRELGRPGYHCAPTAIGTHADPYQPVESELMLTRGLLEVLYELRHPVTLLTKSPLILRDRELLAQMARSGLVHVLTSLNSLDANVARMLEPQAASPQDRLNSMQALSDAGIPVGVVIAPVIPGLTDRDLEPMLAAAHAAGARSAKCAALRLPRALLGQFDQWLLWHATKPVSRLSAVLYGKYGCRLNTMKSPKRVGGLERFSELLDERFARACATLGFPGLPELNTAEFRAPQKAVTDDDTDDRQSCLF